MDHSIQKHFVEDLILQLKLMQAIGRETFIIYKADYDNPKMMYRILVDFCLEHGCCIKESQTHYSISTQIK